MGKIDLQVTLDNSDFKRKMEESTNAIKNSGKTAEEIGKKVQDAINNYSLGAKELLDVARQNFKEQSQVVKQVGEDIEVMQDKLKRMSPSTAQQELTRDVIAAKQALKEETAILNEKKEALDKVSKAYKEHSNETNRTANKLVTLRTQTTNAREELSRMEQEGLRGTEAYNKLQLKLGELTNQMNSTQKQARILADDEKYLTATIQAISGIAGAFSVAQGAVGLFGEKNENLQRIMLKVQSLMAITIGLQQVSQVVNKNNAVSVLFLSKAQNALAKSFGISAAAAKVFMVAITGGLVIGLMALMALFDKLSQKRKEDKEKTEEQAKAQEEFYKTIGNNAAKSLTEFTILQKQYNKVGDTFAAKNKFLQENKKKYEELGLAIKSVADQENLLIKNKEAYINSVISKAYADAYRADIAKKFAEVIKLENAPLQYKSETKVIKTNEMVFAGDAMVRKTDVVFDEEGTQKNIEAAMKAREKAVNTLKSQIVNDTEKLVDLENKSAEDLRKAGINSLTEDKKQKDLKDISSYGKAITDMWQKVYQDIEQARANSIEDEYEKAIEINRINKERELKELDKQIEAIKQKLIEQAKAEYINKTGSEKGFVTPTITLTDDENKAIAERRQQILDEEIEKNKQALKTLIGDYLTYEEKRNAIQEEYSKTRKSLEKQGLNDNIEVLNKLEQEALDNYDSNYVRRQQAFVNWIENIKDLTEKQIKLQLEAAKKSLTSEDLDQETIATLKEKIKELEELLKDKKREEQQIDVGKLGFAEITDALKKERKNLRDELIKGANADKGIIGKYKENIENLENALVDKSLRSLSYIKGMVGAMRDFANTIGDVNSGLSEALETLDTMVSRIGEGISIGKEVGGGYGAIIGGVIGLLVGAGETFAKQIGEANKTEQEAKRSRNKLEQEMFNISQQYTLELIKQNQLLKEAQDIFGVDKEKERLGYLQQLNDAMEEYNRLMQRSGTNMFWGTLSKEDFADYVLGYDSEYLDYLAENVNNQYNNTRYRYEAVMTRITEEYDAYIENIQRVTEQGFGAIAQMFVFTSNGFVSLLDLYPELIDENGKLNTLLLEQIANLDIFTDEQKSFFQILLDNIDLQEQALEGLNSYLADLFGRLKDDWMNGFISQMMRGEDAMLSFKDSVSETLLELMKQSIYSAFFSKIFSDFEEGIMEINNLNPDDRAAQIADLLSGTLDALEQALPEAEATWRSSIDMFSQRGFDILNSRTAMQAQGIQSISQESADRIDGMLTSVQGSIIDIKDMTGTIRERVISINENVIIIRNHTGEMAQKLDRIDYNINQMATNGINVN
ncbi:MAG: hypothetical protein PHD45_07855 [Bacteroidales bacterium]|nr:hypothetical protein [Bacteroidales bacterium]